MPAWRALRSVITPLGVVTMATPSPFITEGIASGAFHIDWLDIVAPIAIGGIWLWWFFGELLKRPMVPVQDPFFESAVEHGKGH